MVRARPAQKSEFMQVVQVAIQGIFGPVFEQALLARGIVDSSSTARQFFLERAVTVGERGQVQEQAGPGPGQDAPFPAIPRKAVSCKWQVADGARAALFLTHRGPRGA